MYMLEHHDRDGDKCISDVEASYVNEIPDNAFNVKEQFGNIHDESEFKNLPCPSSLNDLNKFPNLTTIGERAFFYCAKLESVKLDYVKSVRKDAFKLCQNIKEIVMPNLTKIGNGAFVTKGELKRVEFTTIYTIETEKYVFTGGYCPDVLVLKKNKEPSVNEGSIPWIDKDACKEIRYVE